MVWYFNMLILQPNKSIVLHYVDSTANLMFLIRTIEKSIKNYYYLFILPTLQIQHRSKQKRNHCPPISALSDLYWWFPVYHPLPWRREPQDVLNSVFTRSELDFITIIFTLWFYKKWWPLKENVSILPFNLNLTDLSVFFPEHWT